MRKLSGLGTLLLFLVPLVRCGGATSNSGGPAAPSAVAEDRQPPPKMHGPKKRIAILDFEDTTGRGLGTVTRDTANEILVNSGAFIVVDRQEMTTALNEQALGQSGVINPATAAAAGKMLGLQAIITGKVTEFGDEVSNQRIVMVNELKHTVHARVSIRISDTTTGETWAAESGYGSASEERTTVFQQGGGSHDQDLGKKALRTAIEQMLSKVLAKIDNKPWSSSVAKANVSAGAVYITAGFDVGLPKGATLNVRHTGDEITDPSTNAVIGHELGKEVGQIQVDSDLNEKVTMCRIVNGTDFAAGDLVTLSE